jgi:hypothetical protein
VLLSAAAVHNQDATRKARQAQLTSCTAAEAAGGRQCTQDNWGQARSGLAACTRAPPPAAQVFMPASVVCSAMAAVVQLLLSCPLDGAVTACVEHNTATCGNRFASVICYVKEQIYAMGGRHICVPQQLFLLS